jgi:hypothetical protein
MDAALLTRAAWRATWIAAAICGALAPACAHPTCADEHAPGCWSPPVPSDGGGDTTDAGEDASDGGGGDASDGTDGVAADVEADGVTADR